ncbi:MAG: transglycosylase domain-containing protein [Methylococcales bacterium]|nr:transglycosylase domain-containing protein [Methylococcales bacterium]
MRSRSRVISRFLLVYNVVVLLVIGFVIFKLVRDEVQTSKYQARYLSAISEQLSFKLAPGPSSSIRYPEYGPYDERLGYTLLPEVIKRLEQSGFSVTSQAAFSPMMNELADYGLFNIYHEKTQAGLRITDKADQVVFNAVYPQYGYPNFKSIPPLILQTLLYIENRELLNETHTTVNPAIEWDRLGFAGLQLMAHKLGATSAVPGGSTLATQLEKYRHSKNGYTNSIVDKFRQMGTASVRAYLMGPDTLEMRQEIALSYLNTMPLAATPKLGEIHGLGDGLAAWFGADFAETNNLLSTDALKPNAPVSPQQALAYRQVLGVLLSQRRPSYLLGKGFDALQRLTDSYLRLMADQKVISLELRDAALQVSSARMPKPASVPTKFMTERKTQNVLRTRLARTLGVKSNYELDRLDLTVKTTLDYNTQQAVTSALKLLNQPAEARNAGLLGTRMLNQSTDLAPIVYSLMLFERGKTGNLLRVQTDNYDQPLDINEGIRLDLGSTSKLRTMVHYLELITDTYQLYKDRPVQELNKIELHPRDYLTAWVLERLRANPKISLEDLLNQALDRNYSASPGEYFFTGGGLHHFNNFTKAENGKIMSVRHALRDSVNLVFIRLMRDIVYHHLYKPEGIARWLESTDNPKREEYLQRFADTEGRVYLQRFYAKYKGKSPEEMLDKLTKRVFAKPSRLTMLYRAVYPDHDEMALTAYLNAHLDKSVLANEDIYELYDKYSIEKFDLQDQGYITKIHPLELWLVGYLAQNPKATNEEVMEASAEQRQAVYRWLFKNHRKNAQQRRIMTMLEEEAFKEIHQAWKRVGYPFSALTPSYATSIGASGDRPAALAELTGILLNDGVRLPIVRFDSLHYAQGTPYETIMSKTPSEGERIFAPEIAKVARGAMVGVVAGGTANRLNGAYTDINGKALAVGGKTGTGDHRKQAWGPGGRLLESKFISRAAVFTFFIGERFFGVITAYVEGDNAGLYHFTSSLPVQIVKFLKPVLTPLINNIPPVKKPENPEAKPVAKVEVAETVIPVVAPPVIKKPKPLAKPLTVKAAKPALKEGMPKQVKPSVKVVSATTAKQPIKDVTVKALTPQVKGATAKVEKPIVKAAPAGVAKAQVKEVPEVTSKPPVKAVVDKVAKPPVKVTPAANVAKPKVKPSPAKVVPTDKSDSATRYYKYPTPPVPVAPPPLSPIKPKPQPAQLF